MRCVRNLELIGRGFFLGCFGYSNVCASVVFGESVFGAEESLAILAFEGKDFFFAAVGTFQRCKSTR